MADSIKLPKPKYGQVVVLQKNGDEPRGHGFPLIGVACTIGRSEACDIRVSSADVSLTHCQIAIDEATGEASLKIFGNNTEINGTLVDSEDTVKLHHKDVILIGGRRLRFEYLPPDYKPVPGKVNDDAIDTLKAEVVDTDENREMEEPLVSDKEDSNPTSVPATPITGKRVSFGPYLSPEQFDNNLPPATPVKRGATPRRSVRYSSLKFTRPPVDSVIEEEPPKEEETTKIVVEESVLERTTDDSVGKTSEDDLQISDAMSTVSGDGLSAMSDVSNVSVLPSDCCSYLEDSMSVELSSVSQPEENGLSTDLDPAEPPSLQDTPVASPSATEADSTSDHIDHDDAEKSDLGPKKHHNEISEEEILSSLSPKLDSPTQPAEEVARSPETNYSDGPEKNETQESSPVIPKGGSDDSQDPKKLKLTPKSAPESPKADYTNVDGVKTLLQTPKPLPESPKADYTNVEGVKKLLQTPKPVPETPKADYTNVDGVKKLLQTPKPAPESPKADYTNVEGIKKIMQTPKPTPESPKADYTNVEGVKKIMQTPKPAPASPQADYSNVDGIRKMMQTPKQQPESLKADYTDVTGIKKLLQTPKPIAESPKSDYTDVEGVEQLMKTPDTVTVNMVTSLSSSDQNANEQVEASSKQTVPNKRQSKASTAPSTSPKSDFAESQSPPAALMVGDDEDDDPSSLDGARLEAKKEKAEDVIKETSQETVESSAAESAKDTASTCVNSDKTQDVSMDVSNNKSAVVATPRRGGRRIASTPTPKKSTETPKSTRSRRGQKIDVPPVEQNEAPQSEASNTGHSINNSEQPVESETKTDSETLQTREESSPKSNCDEEAIVPNVDNTPIPTPRRGGRRPPVSSAKQGSAKKSTGRTRTAKTSQEEAQTEESVKLQSAVEESVDPPKSAGRSTRRKPAQEQQTTESEELQSSPTNLKDETPTSSEVKEPTEDKNSGSENPPTGGEEMAEEGQDEKLAEAVPAESALGTRKRGTRKAAPAKEPVPKMARTKRKMPADKEQMEPEAVAENEPAITEKSPSELTEIDKFSTPKRRGRQAAVVAGEAASTASPRSTRSNRGVSEATVNISEPVSEEIKDEESNHRPSRSKRSKKGSISEEQVPAETDSKVPVVRLTRVKLPTEATTPSSPAIASTGRRTRGRMTKASGPSENDKSNEDNVNETQQQDSELSEKQPTTRKTRRRVVKVDVAEQENNESRDESKPPIEDSLQQDSKKVASPQGAARTKRTAATQESTDSTVPPVQDKKRRKAKKPLDDVELLHEGKGHAADIHANHFPDEVPAEEVPSTRTTRAKRTGAHVHFDLPSSSKLARSPQKEVTASVPVSPTVRLERDPDIDSLATSSKSVTEEPVVEEAPRKAKRGRAKAEADTEESTKSPAKAKRATRGTKVEAEPKETVDLLPRRTRRARN